MVKARLSPHSLANSHMNTHTHLSLSIHLNFPFHAKEVVTHLATSSGKNSPTPAAALLRWVKRWSLLGPSAAPSEALPPYHACIALCGWVYVWVVEGWEERCDSIGRVVRSTKSETYEWLLCIYTRTHAYTHTRIHGHTLHTWIIIEAVGLVGGERRGAVTENVTEIRDFRAELCDYPIEMRSERTRKDHGLQRECVREERSVGWGRRR